MKEKLTRNHFPFVGLERKENMRKKNTEKMKKKTYFFYLFKTKRKQEKKKQFQLNSTFAEKKNSLLSIKNKKLVFLDLVLLLVASYSSSSMTLES